MRVFVPTETITGERRVALVPEAVTKLCKLGLEVSVQSNAGTSAGHDDNQYVNAGAQIVPN